MLPGSKGILTRLLKVLAWTAVSAFVLFITGVIVTTLQKPDFSIAAYPNAEEIDGEPSHIVILVHGTFAPGADWTAPDSSLSRAIRHQITSEKIQFVRFDWAGFFGTALNNSHFHRYAAGERLADVLREARSRHPKTQIFVVAHSHGGNVALYAAQLMPHIDGIVTMGTPFISVTPRDFKGDVAVRATMHIGAFIIWVVLICASTVVGVCVFLAGVSLLRLRWIEIKVLGGILALIGFGLTMWPWEPTTEQVYVSSGGGRYETRIKYKLSDAAEKLRVSTDEFFLAAIMKGWSETGANAADRLTASIPVGVPVLCMTTQADEALFSLGQVTPTLGLPLRIISDPSLATTIWLIAISMCLGAGLLVGAKAAYESWREGGGGFANGALSIFIGALVAYGTAVALAMVAVAVLGIVASLSVILRAPASAPYLLSYGSSDIIAQYTTKIAVSAEPLTAKGEARCETKTFDFGSPKGLAHSEYYQNPQSVAYIANWLGLRESAAHGRTGGN